MVFAQSSASQVSLPPGEHHPWLRSKVSLSSIANAMRKRKLSSPQDFPVPHPQNYTKGYGPFTLSLNADHEASSGLPIFTNGAVISGSLEISKIAKLLQSIQVMVTGRIIIQDMGASGAGETIMFSHVFYEWSREYNSSPPPTLVPLSYSFPSKYIDHTTGFEHQVPPTYKAHLNAALPGLRVKVQYDLSVKIVRSRRKIPFLTKTTRLHMPFIYRPRHHLLERIVLPSNPRFRPGTADSRPGSSRSGHKGHGNTQAQKVFVYSTPSLYGERKTEVKLYLPRGEVCMLDEPIPFVIKVFAADHVLEELHSSVPPVTNPKNDHASFHPIRPGSSSKVKRPRTGTSKIKIKLELLRTTKVDAKCTQFAEAGGSGYVGGTQALSEGVIERLTRGSDWIAWSGVIVTPSDVKCGGFTACRLEVHDKLELSILPAGSSRSPVISFSESVPVKLTPRTTLKSTGSTTTLIPGGSKRSPGMNYYPPPSTSSSLASNTSWLSSDGGYR